MTTIEFWNTSTSQFDTIEVRFIRHTTPTDRWYVQRFDNGRTLGWLCPPRNRGKLDRQWSTHVPAEAFRGEGTDDLGDVLDRVPADLFGHGKDQFTSPAIAYDRTRREAAHELITHLSRHRAPALGHGRHPRVERYMSAERLDAERAVH